MLFEYNDSNGQLASIQLPIEENSFEEYREELKGSELDDLGDWEFWKLRDYLFKVLILEAHKDNLIQFLKKVLLNQFEFKEEHKGGKISVVDVFYHFYGGSIFIFAEPSYTLYPNYPIKDRLEIDLEYDTDQLEHLLEQLLIGFGVSYIGWMENGEALSNSELDLGELFGNFILKCWSTAKQETSSQVLGMMFYATGGGGCMDLDNGHFLDETDAAIRLYVKQKNIDL